MNLSYIINEITKNWRNKQWWNNRIIYHLVGGYYRRLMKNKGTHVMNEDWDNLIVLDACRYDTFVEVSGVKTKYRISRGSNTPEFLEENFAEREFLDTIIVTANPHVDLRVKSSFYKVISVWKHEWDNKLNTVLPEKLLEYSLRTGEEYPDKRLIVWFLQPHFPFIEDPQLFPHGYKEGYNHAIIGKIPDPVTDPWREAARGNLDINRIWKSYKRNLEIVIPYAFELANKLNGKTVVTSDHGNAFKRLIFPIPIRVAGHLRGIHIPELVKVPWLVFDDGKRKEIKTADEKEKLKDQIKKLKGKA